MAIGADLSFEVSVPGRETVHGSVHGHANRLTLEVDDMGPFIGAGGSSAGRAMAEQMASRGVVLRVESGGVHLATVGAVNAPWWQRLATRSARIRLGSLRGVGVALRAMRDTKPDVLPDLDTARAMAPPPTLFPIFPTMARPGPPPPVSTTHDPRRGGSPSLVVQSAPTWEGVSRQPFVISGDVTVIGSDESCDIVLPRLQPQHAEIHHDDDDELVLVPSGDDVSVNGVRGDRLLLRTGSRVQLGDWTLAYTRAEFADHGRPYGGRQGGELGEQRRQPRRAPRPSDPPA